MTIDIYRYIVIIDGKTWYFEDFRSAMKFVESTSELKGYIKVYKLVYTNGELV